MTPDPITPEMDRRNGRVFLFNYLLIFLAAPVIYVGVVQGALASRLGASATLSNLPASTYLLGQVAPLLLSWAVPQRHERLVVVWANALTTALLVLVCLSLALPFTPEVRIGALVLQGLFQGLSASASLVFMIQCLRRGTTLEGRAQTLKRTFSLSPIAAVLGSLGAQYVLKPGLPAVAWPWDFALIYAFGVPCTAGVALLSLRFQLPRVTDTAREPLGPWLAASLREFSSSRMLVMLWVAYLLWNCTLGATTNLALYTREAMGRGPQELSGWIMAIRFGTKAAGGWLLGVLALRFGLRAGVLATIVFVGAAALWGWLVPGAAFLAAFGLMGIGELGGTYFPNYVAALSPVASSARNLSLLTLAGPASSFAPTLYGALTDRYGFPSSFVAALVCAAAALALASRAPREIGDPTA